MSIYSDYDAGALDDDEFRSLCAWENAKDRYDSDHEFDEDIDDNMCKYCMYSDDGICTADNCPLDEE